MKKVKIGIDYVVDKWVYNRVVRYMKLNVKC